MKRRSLTFSCAVTLLALISGAPGRARAPSDEHAPTSAQRLIRAEIRVGNKVVLRGTTSDDGSRDADEVWLAASEIKLLPTEQFADLEVPARAKKFPVLGTPVVPDPKFPESDHEMHHHDAVLSVAYGGKLEAMMIPIQRTTTRYGKTAWQIPKDLLTDRFDWRLITRHRARQLKNLQRKK
jgi:hypothetical protein